MQNNDKNNRNNNEPPSSPSQKQDTDGSTGKSSRETVIVSTKTHDGGGMNMNVRPTANEGGGQQSSNANGGSGDGGNRSETAMKTTSRPDNFQRYSDNDTRMMTLLGLEPSSNPNDGEVPEDWRQLTGFQGLGRRRQPGINDDHGAEEVNATGAVAVAANDNRETTMTRQTRLSWEVHMNALANMWMQRGELDIPVQEPEPRRVEPRQEQQRGSGGENQNGPDYEE